MISKNSYDFLVDTNAIITKISVILSTVNMTIGVRLYVSTQGYKNKFDINQFSTYTLIINSYA